MLGVHGVRSEHTVRVTQGMHEMHDTHSAQGVYRVQHMRVMLRAHVMHSVRV